MSSSPAYKDTPAEFYAQFPGAKRPRGQYIKYILSRIRHLGLELEKIGVKLFYVRWSRAAAFGEHGETTEFNHIYDMPRGLPRVFFSERDLYHAACAPAAKLHVSHMVARDLWPAVNKVFKKIFAGRTLGIQTEEDAIVVNMAAGKPLVKNVVKEPHVVIIRLEDQSHSVGGEEGIKSVSRALGKDGLVTEYPAAAIGELEIDVYIAKDKLAAATKRLRAIKKFGRWPVDYVEVR